MAYIEAIWPYIYRGVNGAFYFVLNLIRTFFKVAIEEIKGL
jgi:hypothetical protein